MATLRTFAGNCLSEARPIVLTIFSFRFAVGVALAAQIGDQGRPLRALAVGAVWVTAVFAVYLFNGVMDVREDRANGSRRPIASGALDPRAAAVVAGLAAASALVGAVALGGTAAWTTGALLALGYAYSGRPFQIKRRSSGTFAVGTVAGLLTYFTGFAAYTGDRWDTHSVALPIFALAASLWMGAVGTPTKDLPDAAGDGAAGRRTLAVRYGESATRVVASVVAVGLAVAFCAAVAVLGLPLVGPELAMLGGAAVLSIVALTRLSKGDRPRRRRPYQVFMATQYAMHLTVILPLTV